MGKGSTIFNIVFFLAPVLLLVSLSMFIGLPNGELVLYSAILSFAGVSLLFIAKLPAIRAGRYADFGPNSLTKNGKALYYVSYGVLVLALCAWVALGVSNSFGAANV